MHLLAIGSMPPDRPNVGARHFVRTVIGSCNAPSRPGDGLFTPGLRFPRAHFVPLQFASRDGFPKLLLWSCQLDRGDQDPTSASRKHEPYPCCGRAILLRGVTKIP